MVTRNECFTPPRAESTEEGWYRTLNRECKNKDQKCYVKDPNGTYHYFCTKEKDCKLDNVTGKPIQEPMAWQVRYA